jgi:tRNA (guanine37-N1)-methyltransferase
MRGLRGGTPLFEFRVVTLFPDLFAGFLEASLVGRARKGGLLSVDLVDLREFAHDRHRTVDDAPYGGGSGMVMKTAPILEMLAAAKPSHRVLLTPQGRPIDQRKVRELASTSPLLLFCGRYEGVDERVRESLATEEVSIGDFVLTGGEVAALAVIEATVRLLPGALGDEASAAADSFSDGILDHPHYTRPAMLRGCGVPEVLLSGDHGRIRVWRRRQALRVTRERRPELLAAARLTAEDRSLLREMESEAHAGRYDETAVVHD